MKNLIHSTKNYGYLVIVLCLTGTVFSQSLSNYTFSASSGTYTDLSSPTFPTMSSADDGFVNSISIGFDFFYMGTKYSTIGICTNGYVSFGTAASSVSNNLNSGGGRPLVAPLWDDLHAVTTGSNISYKLEGDAPTRTFTVQFNDMKWNYEASGAVMDFQVILYETTGVVKFVYDREATAYNAGTTGGASIGITATGTSTNNYMSLSSSGSSPSTSLSSETSSITAKPANGQTYTFTPPVPSAPSSLSFTSISPTAMTLNWTDNSANETGFAVYRSTDNVTFTYQTITAANATSYAATGLSDATTYYWKVFAVSEGGVSSALTGSQITGTVPVIATTTITGITTTAGTSGGNITAGSELTVSGICWDTSTDPTTALGTKTTDGATTITSFASSLTGLSAETYYYVRAYATNVLGTSYGANVNFYTFSTEPTGHSAEFSGAAVGTQIDLTFTAASTYGADGYIILRLAGATAPDNTNINDGTAPGSLTMPGSTVLVTTITNSATTSYSNTGLAPLTQYSYAIIPYNWDAANAATYNYLTSATIPTCSATTPDVPSNEGLAMAGNFVNNGTLDQSDDANYFRMAGTGKSVTGTGVFTAVKLNVNGTVTFDGTISTGTFSKTYVNASKTFTVAAGKTFVNGTFINDGTTTINSGSTFKNSGDWTNNGTVTAVSTSDVEFNGAAAQTIDGTVSTTFADLTVNNSSGDVSMGIDATVGETLTLTDGLLKTVSYTLTLGSDGANATVSGGGAASYIAAYDNSGTIGYVKQYTNVAASTVYSFPIGDATNYVPLSLTLTSGTLALSDAYLTTYTKDAKVPNLNSSLVTYLDRFWDLQTVGITDPVFDISYTYVNGDLAGSEVGMLPVMKSGSTWFKPTGSSFTDGTEAGAGSTDEGTNTITWTGFSSFGSFGGLPNGAVALPIQLISFTGSKQGRDNRLAWSTMSELNNDFFTVEKTTDGDNYELVGTEKGAGNSLSLQNYSLLDYHVKPVVNYYRLKQTDFDGMYTFSEVISVDNRTSATDKQISLVTNLLGQEVNELYRGVVIIVYTDGTSMKVIQ